MKLSHLLLSFSVILLLTACGYRPSSHYAKEQLQGKIFVNLSIDLEDPRNAVLIKDAMNEIIVHRLDSEIVYKRSLADTVMDIKLKSVSMNVIQDDELGYNKLYNAVVTIEVKYTTAEKSETFNVRGDTDFSVSNGTTTIDSTKRFNAIREASSKALEEVISKIAVNSFKKTK